MTRLGGGNDREMVEKCRIAKSPLCETVLIENIYSSNCLTVDMTVESFIHKIYRAYFVTLQSFIYTHENLMMMVVITMTRIADGGDAALTRNDQQNVHTSVMMH